VVVFEDRFSGVVAVYVNSGFGYLIFNADRSKLNDSIKNRNILPVSKKSEYEVMECEK
jgi:hypothetical protein